MAMYQVDSQEVALAAANAARTADEIRASVTSMMAQLQALQASWVGGASASFQEVLLSWHTTQVQVEASLDSVSNALTQASATYSDAEGAATALFAGR